jgi:hypothetical protein
LLRDTIAISTGPLAIRVAATDFLVVVVEFLEAAFLVAFIRFI